MEDVPQESLFDDDVPQESLWDDDELSAEDEPPAQVKPPPDSTLEQVPQESLFDDDVPQESLWDDEYPAPEPDDEQNPLEEAKNLLDRGRQVFKALFKEARNMQEYRRVLATPDRNAQFESKLLAKAKKINSRLGTDLPDNALNETVRRMATSIAAWEHSPKRQKERQKKQAAKRRRQNRGRDMQIVYHIGNGESQRSIAARYELSRGAVEHVLMRDAPHLLDRRKKDELPPD